MFPGFGRGKRKRSNREKFWAAIDVDGNTFKNLGGRGLKWAYFLLDSLEDQCCPSP